jgi:glycine/D-amino acid oxidase-like deaminating enzyme
VRVTAHGWWLEEAGAVAARPALAGDVVVDVVVLGGGYTGMWAAWHLLERAPGIRVVVLEAEVCGEGPSGRNGGFADHLAHAAPRLREVGGDEGARAAIAASIESVRAIGAWCAGNDVDAWFRPAGQIVASAAPAQDSASDDATAACAALGLGAELTPLDGDAVAARCASPVLRGGAFAPSTATVQPARLARGLRRRLIERDVAIFEHSRVEGLRDTPAGVEARTRSGRVQATAAVLALGPRSVAARPLRRHLTVTSSHLIVTEPVPDVLDAIGWTGGEAITDGRHLVHYFRTTPDGRIAFGWGGGRIVCGSRLQPRDEADRSLALRVRADLLRFFPALRGRRIEHAWGGPIDASPAHLPIVDSLPGGRVHFALGYTGNGVGPSELCGRILARLALDERDGLTRLAIVAPGRAGLRLLPPEPLRVIGGEAIRRGLAARELAEEAERAPGRLARALSGVPGVLGIRIGR